MYIFILYSIFNITSSLGYEYSNIVINYASFTHELHIDYIFIYNICNIRSSLSYVSMIFIFICNIFKIGSPLHIHM